MKARFAILLIVVVLFTGSTAFASNEATKTATLPSTLVVNVTVQQVIGLTLTAGAPSPVAAYGGNYSINFGDMEAAVIDDPCCSHVAASAPATREAYIPTAFSRPTTLISAKSAVRNAVLTRVTRASAAPMNTAEPTAADS